MTALFSFSSSLVILDSRAFTMPSLIDVGHICSYGYLFCWSMYHMRGMGRRTDPLNVALQDDLARCVTMQRDPTKSRTDCHGPVCRLVDGSNCSWKKIIKKDTIQNYIYIDKYIYIYIYKYKKKLYIVQNIYRPFVPLKFMLCTGDTWCSGYHVIILHRLVLMTRGCFDGVFFMSSAFFAINAFV